MNRPRLPFPRLFLFRLALAAGLAAFALHATRAAAAELVRGPEVSAGAHGATIRWVTDVATGARVRYGLDRARLDQVAEGPVEARHVVELERLKAGTTYHFTIGTARVVLATNTFTTLGSAAAGDAPATSARPAPAQGGAGGSQGSPAARPQAPPSRESWGSPRSLADHFQRHGADFGSRDAEEYARQAWEFRQRAVVEGLPAKRDGDGVLRIYDPKTRAFGAYNRDGTTRTYFKPGRRDYFDDQPGKPVDLKREER